MSKLIELSPMLLLAASSAMLGLVTDGRPEPTLMLREVGQPAGPVWDTAFVHHVGYWSHFEYDLGRSSWPLPPTNDSNVWARFAEAQHVLIDGPPRIGDVFLQWSTRRKRFVHSGIVAAYRHATGVLPNGKVYLSCETIEGNVDVAGRWHQTGIHRLTRKLVPEKGDRLIRWADVGRGAPMIVPAPGHVCLAMLMRERAA